MGKIMEFLAKLRTKNAEITYKSAIKKYLKFIYGDELESRLKDDNEMEIHEKFVERYFTENRNYGQDLVNFAVFLTKQNTAPKTANINREIIDEGVMNSNHWIRSFYSYNPKGKKWKISIRSVQHYW